MTEPDPLTRKVFLAETAAVNEHLGLPVPSAPADTDLHDRIADAVVPLLLDTLPKAIARSRGYEVADVVLAALPAPADRAAVLREAADELAQGLGHEESVRELRRMADEARQAGPKRTPMDPVHILGVDSEDPDQSAALRARLQARPTPAARADEAQHATTASPTPDGT